MTMLFYRLWYRCGGLLALAKRSTPYFVLTAIILFGVLAAAVSNILTVTDTGGAVLVAVLQLTTFFSVIIPFAVVVSGLFLIIGYEVYANKLYDYLCGAYSRVGRAHENEYGIQFSGDTKEEVNKWMTLPLPMKRKWAMIEAGIRPENAMAKDLRRMTVEDFQITAALNNVRPLSPHRFLGRDKVAVMRGSDTSL